jgi:aspartyl-tRNA(Asn)/glutamyl-tRNA(Gln) amidotransferase subunit A
MFSSLDHLARALATGERTAAALADEALARAADPQGEGARVFVALDPERTRAEAQASDLLRRHGIVPSPLAGIPISVKDLFDVIGQPTRAGSRALAGAPAERDAPPIARLRAAGAVFTGRTNMTEFAYSGVGLNPHHGTPANPWDRATGRIPGGSSSGAAVSVTDGMAAAGIGTDTGGSCRIPAALCGIVGFKPTASRIPLEGCVPLSPSLDSVGCFATTVAGVALVDAVMAGEEPAAPAPADLDGLRILVPRTVVLDRMDDEVGRAFERALARLSQAGARLVERDVPLLARLPELAAGGGIVAAKAYAWHRDLLAQEGDAYDPRVRSRIRLGETIPAGDYQRLIAVRKAFIAEARQAFAPFDAVAMPAVPIVAPPFSAFDSDEAFTDLNRLLLRNPSVANLLDACAISLPCHEAGRAPVGLGLTALAGQDRRLLAIAAAAEAALR